MPTKDPPEAGTLDPTCMSEISTTAPFGSACRGDKLFVNATCNSILRTCDVLLPSYTEQHEAIALVGGIAGCGMRISPHKSNIGKAPTPVLVVQPDLFDYKGT